MADPKTERKESTLILFTVDADLSQQGMMPGVTRLLDRKKLQLAGKLSGQTTPASESDIGPPEPSVVSALIPALSPPGPLPSPPARRPSPPLTATVTSPGIRPAPSRRTAAAASSRKALTVWSRREFENDGPQFPTLTDSAIRDWKVHLGQLFDARFVSALFLEYTLPTGNHRSAICFKACAAVQPDRRLSLWSGFHLAAGTDPVLDAALAKHGFWQSSPKTNELLRQALGVTELEWLSVLKSGSSLAVLVSSASLQPELSAWRPNAEAVQGLKLAA